MSVDRRARKRAHYRLVGLQARGHTPACSTSTLRQDWPSRPTAPPPRTGRWRRCDRSAPSRRCPRHRLRHAAQPPRRPGRAGRRRAPAALQGRRPGRRCCTSSRATPWPGMAPRSTCRPSADALEVGATLGIVIGRTACRVARGGRAVVRGRLHDRAATSACRTSASTARRCARRRAMVSARSAPGSSPRAGGRRRCLGRDGAVDGRLSTARQHHRHRNRRVAVGSSDVTEFMTFHPAMC